MQYRREIDGLRALAVMSVVLFHTGMDVLPGGYVGVDIFFVISGYLITSIIVSDLKSGTFSLAQFYERRARRILPALFVMLLLTMLIAAFVLAPFSGRAFYRSVAATGLFSSNILFFLEAQDYFDVSGDLKPLLHTWSLGVEEQYYVLFPLFVLFIWWWNRRLLLPAAVVVAALASLVASQMRLATNPEESFYLLLARVWEFAVGAMVALLHSEESGRQLKPVRAWILESGGAAGLALMALAILVFDRKTPFPGIFALVPVVGAAMFIYFARPDTYVAELLGARILVGIGLISYSIYLWHQPIYAIARHLTLTELSHAQYLLAIAVTILAGYLSYRFVERPFRANKNVSSRTVAALSVLGSTAFVAIGIAGHLTVGFQNLKLAAIPTERQHIFVDHFKELAEKRLIEQDVNQSEKVSGRRVLVIGDSMAGDFLLAARAVSDRFPGIGFVRGSLSG